MISGNVGCVCSMKRNAVYAVTDRYAKKIEQDMGTTSVRYQKISNKYNDEFSDMQFISPPPKIPWKAIGLATTLFILGTLLLVMGILLLAGVIDAKYSDRTWPVLILGLIMFIPGFYHVRIAYYAYKGEQGYSFDDIPEFD